MANSDYVAMLKQDVAAWNQWRQANPDVHEVDLGQADLRNANLQGANLRWADLRNADLREVNLHEANFHKADLQEADLRGANLKRVDFCRADLSEAKLQGADLSYSILVETNFTKASLQSCRVYGCAAWNLTLKEVKQQDLAVSKEGESLITVDDLEVAQFIYLLLNNEKIRQVIDTVTSKAVLILGRFTLERKAILDALREKLQKLNYLPMMFDFEKPTDKDFTETIMTLAGMCRFIIADITNPSSSPLELQATVPNYMIPLVPIIQKGEKPFAMFKDLYGKYDWVLKPLEYPNKERLVDKLKTAIVNPALRKYKTLAKRKVAELPTRSI